MKYSSERIYVRFWNVEDASLLLDLQVRNREAIERTSGSTRDDAYYSLDKQRAIIESWDKREKKEFAIPSVFFYIQRMNLWARYLCSRS
ncbi:hypothetical protein P9222_23350 [Paenibacillus amylolyticus]|nr:hypothetical protein [Paenibacillus amylolyticus]WFR61370.1 hypothetical protein P9222_23350 [Paenibacillus amylolyticus]